MYLGGCIDPIVSACFISTDHHIVAADFNFSFQTRAQCKARKAERIHWNKISTILVDMDKPIPADPFISPRITFRDSTSWTKEFIQNKDLYEDIQSITKEGSVIDDTFAIPFLREMEDIRESLKCDSTGISRDDQDRGVLILRRADIKERCNVGLIRAMDGLKEIMHQLKLKKWWTQFTKFRSRSIE